MELKIWDLTIILAFLNAYCIFSNDVDPGMVLKYPERAPTLTALLISCLKMKPTENLRLTKFIHAFINRFLHFPQRFLPKLRNNSENSTRRNLTQPVRHFAESPRQPSPRIFANISIVALKIRTFFTGTRTLRHCGDACEISKGQLDFYAWKWGK